VLPQKPHFHQKTSKKPLSHFVNLSVVSTHFQKNYVLTFFGASQKLCFHRGQLQKTFFDAFQKISIVKL